MFIFHFGPFRYWYDFQTKLHHAELYEEDLPVLIQPPVFLQVAVTNYCNLQCPYCYASSSPTKSTEWDEHSLFEVLSRLSKEGLTAVAFGGGEPFSVKWFASLLTNLRKQTNLELSVTSNMTLITPKLAQEIHDLDLEVRCSINSLKEYHHRKHGMQNLIDAEVKFGINSMLIRENDFLLSPEMDSLANQLGGLDILLLEGQKTGRGVLTPLSDLQISQTVFSLKRLVRNGKIKFSSSLSRLFKNANWIFPPQLTRYPGFFGSLNHKKHLKHTSFCPGSCAVPISENPMASWKELIERACVYRETRGAVQLI